jgi:hypothetical protein
MSSASRMPWLALSETSSTMHGNPPPPPPAAQTGPGPRRAQPGTRVGPRPRLPTAAVAGPCRWRSARQRRDSVAAPIARQQPPLPRASGYPRQPLRRPARCSPGAAGASVGVAGANRDDRSAAERQGRRCRRPDQGPSGWLPEGSRRRGRCGRALAGALAVPPALTRQGRWPCRRSPFLRREERFGPASWSVTFAWPVMPGSRARSSGSMPCLDSHLRQARIPSRIYVRSDLLPSPAGTLLAESFQFVWCPVINRLTELPVPRGRQVSRGILLTLSKIKAAAEAAAAPAT